MTRSSHVFCSQRNKIQNNMKKVLILCGFIAAFLCLAQNANAQYARKGANLVDMNKTVLSDQAIINLVGNDVYEQTVIGARKQFKAGNGLIIGGIVGMGAGLAGAVLTGKTIADRGYSDLETAMSNDGAIAAMYIGSSALASLGATAFSGGIVLKTIGKKRLNWVADHANGVAMTYHVGATPNGLGVTLQF
jgi:hypothetical protein